MTWALKAKAYAWSRSTNSMQRNVLLLSWLQTWLFTPIGRMSYL